MGRAGDVAPGRIDVVGVDNFKFEIAVGGLAVFGMEVLLHAEDAVGEYPGRLGGNAFGRLAAAGLYHAGGMGVAAEEFDGVDNRGGAAEAFGL